MSLSITVSSLAQTHSLIKKTDFNGAISVLTHNEISDNSDPLNLHRLPVFEKYTDHEIITVSDVGTDDSTVTPLQDIQNWLAQGLDPHVPTYDNMMKLISALKYHIYCSKTQDYHLLIHCYGGVSRSVAATFIAYLLLHDGDVQKSWTDLQTATKTKNPTPNPTLIWFACEIMRWPHDAYHLARKALWGDASSIPSHTLS